MAVVGYTKEGFIVRNSWGEDWTDKGYTIYPFEDWGAHWEIWTSIDKTSVLPDFNSEDYVRPISARGLLWVVAGILFSYSLITKK